MPDSSLEMQRHPAGSKKVFACGPKMPVTPAGGESPEVQKARYWEKFMKEIRFHGRAGQGVALCARVVVTAYVHEGKWGSCFPSFGQERRGPPVAAFARLDDKPIREVTQVYNPDCLMVADPYLIRLPGILNGIRPGGILVLNAAKPVKDRLHERLSAVASVDATSIGLEELGKAVTNTCMLGAFVRATGWMRLDSVLNTLREYFSGDLLEKNVRCVERGFEETHILSIKDFEGASYEIH